jgi:membrane fusion protein (multidrug efflux system)
MNTIEKAQSNGHRATVKAEDIQAEELKFQPSPDVTLDQPVEGDSAQSPVPTVKPARKRSVKLLLGTLLGLGAIAASSFGYRWWQYASSHEQTDNAAVSGHVYQVSSRVAGTIKAVPVDDNESVHPGELLVQIDPQDYQVKVQQARAALAIAQRQATAAQTTIAQVGTTAQAQATEAQGNVANAIAAISTAEATVTEAQAGVPEAEAKLAQTQATLQQAQADYNRYQALANEGAIPRQQLESARAAYNVALAQQNAAQQGIRQARAKLAQAQQGVNQAQAQLQATKGGLQQAKATGVQTDVNRSQYEAAVAAIDQAQAQLAEAQLQLSYTNITAPAEGRVGRKTVEVGQRVQAGQPLMAVVGNQMWIVANFKETQVRKMHPGETVDIELDAFPGHSFKGRVDSLSPASGSQFALLPPDNATGNFTKVVQRIPVKVTFDPKSIQGYEAQITPGMSATVSVEVQ